jgi:nanoRNase/pAp phosphatase (c-di-AMP/oligoRNAs hydrolase)
MVTRRYTMPEMDRPFPKAVSQSKRYENLQKVVTTDDTLAIVITADPDAMASALALRRIFWRRARKTQIVRANTVERADNLALIHSLRVEMQDLASLDREQITKWALVDSQPHHNSGFDELAFDIIIDHHPAGPEYTAAHIDIRDSYGATSTIMTEYLRTGGIEPSSRLATALFLGIKNDTNDFLRSAISNDLNAFRYLHGYANLNVVKKIESSEMTRKTLRSLEEAIENLSIYKEVAFVHMGKVNNPDILVIMADFFLKLAEVSWCIVCGSFGRNLVIIMRYVGFRQDAGKTAEKLFGKWGTAGGHKGAARAEVPLVRVRELHPRATQPERRFVLSRIHREWKS